MATKRKKKSLPKKYYHCKNQSGMNESSIIISSMGVNTNWFFMHKNNKKLIWNLDSTMELFKSFSSLEAREYLDIQKRNENPIMIVLMQYNFQEEKEWEKEFEWAPRTKNVIQKILLFQPILYTTNYTCQVISCSDCISVKECGECRKLLNKAKDLEEHFQTLVSCPSWPYMVKCDWIEDNQRDFRDMPQYGFHFNEKVETLKLDLNALMKMYLNK